MGELPAEGVVLGVGEVVLGAVDAGGGDALVCAVVGLVEVFLDELLFLAAACDAAPFHEHGYVSGAELVLACGVVVLPAGAEAVEVFYGEAYLGDELAIVVPQQRLGLGKAVATALVDGVGEGVYLKL